MVMPTETFYHNIVLKGSGNPDIQAALEYLRLLVRNCPKCGGQGTYLTELLPDDYHRYESTPPTRMRTLGCGMCVHIREILGMDILTNDPPINNYTCYEGIKRDATYSNRAM